MRQSACFVIIVSTFAAFLLHTSGLSVRLYDGPDLKLFLLCVVGWEMGFFVSTRAKQTDDPLLLQIV